MAVLVPGVGCRLFGGELRHVWGGWAAACHRSLSAQHQGLGLSQHVGVWLAISTPGCWSAADSLRCCCCLRIVRLRLCSCRT